MTRRKALCAGSVSRSPMCWLMKTWFPTASATAFFKCAPTARMISECECGMRIVLAICHSDSALRIPQLNRQRRVAARPAQNHLAAEHHAHDRIVHVPDDGAVVDEKNIGDAAEPLQTPRVHRCKSARRSNCRSWRRRENPVPPSADDAAGSTAASRRDWDCREPPRHLTICDLTICDCLRRRSKTIGASGERSSRPSNGETSQTAFTLSSDGNIRANGFSSRCFRSRRRLTAASFRASTIK